MAHLFEGQETTVTSLKRIKTCNERIVYVVLKQKKDGMFLCEDKITHELWSFSETEIDLSREGKSMAEAQKPCLKRKNCRQDSLSQCEKFCKDPECLGLKDVMDKFLNAYIDAALWSSVDDNDTSLDSLYSNTDISSETLKKMTEDCKKFQEENAKDIEGRVELAGHDFWLSRNGHGSGFFDGEWGDMTGDRLQEASRRFGECYLYVGDDGKLYI